MQLFAGPLFNNFNELNGSLAMEEPSSSIFAIILLKLMNKPNLGS